MHSRPPLGARSGMSVRKRSVRVTLVLAGAVALAACDEAPRQRDLYASLEDCRKDWGAEQNCERAPAGTGARPATTSTSSYWYGPPRPASRDARGQPAPARNAVAAHSVSRGGFGSSAAFHSSGG
ncbi:MAG: hypothetical protein IT514_03255 [Burkholderiales bacterium]|nr:hypothetical protein [Burkholderiales bacterium]